MGYHDLKSSEKLLTLILSKKVLQNIFFEGPA